MYRTIRFRLFVTLALNLALLIALVALRLC